MSNPYAVGTIFNPRKLEYKIGEHRQISTLGEEYQLIQDSQDIDATLESIGRMDMRDELEHLFVLVGDGEYLEVWYGIRFTPHYTDNVFRIA